MNNLPLLFLGIFFTLAFSWTGLILTSQIQFGGLEQTTQQLDAEGNLMEDEDLFPQQIVGLAKHGKEVYIDLGCMYCHSQQVRRPGFGADTERGWGNRQSVPRDYILQDRVVLGTMRTGPDLKNIGDRIPSTDWHHQHFYNPQITSPGSVMPPYAFLYRVQPVEDESHPNAVSIPESSPYHPGPGLEVIPTRRAEALVAYMLSLRLNYSLPEAPIVEQ